MSEFIFLFRGGVYANQSPEEAQAHMQKWFEWMGSLREQGKFVGAQPLTKEGKQVKGNKKIVISCTLKVIEELLEDYSFLRVHRSFVVNLDEVEKYVKADGGYLVMSDGSQIYVSRNKKEELLKKLTHE